MHRASMMRNTRGYSLLELETPGRAAPTMADAQRIAAVHPHAAPDSPWFEAGGRAAFRVSAR
jgi:hypothetical protein